MSAIRRRVLVSILIVSVNIHGLRASGKHLVKAARVKVATDAQRRECQARFGRSGSALPELLKQAAAALPQPYFVHPEEIVYIEDLARFLDCLGITDEIKRHTLLNDRSFVFGNAMPIYFNGSAGGNRGAVSAFTQSPGQSYLKYLFASYIGHEWLHATGEQMEGPALRFELALLESFRAKLPKTEITTAYIEKVKSMIGEADSLQSMRNTLMSTSGKSLTAWSTAANQNRRE